MGGKAQYYVIVVVDIEGFGSRRDPVQQWLSESLWRLVDEALAEAGVSREGCPPPKHDGDGGFLLFPGSVPKVVLSGRFIDQLHAGLLAHAQVHSEEAALRLRVVLHAGEVAHDGRGWVGTDLNTACRLGGLQSLRDALASAPRAGLVLGVTQDWYRAVIRHDAPEVPAGAFRPVRFRAKEVDDTAWVRVPGYERPPGLPPEAAGREANGGREGSGRGATGKAETETAQAAALPGVRNVGRFAGAVIHAEQVYGGDHHSGGGTGTGSGR